MYADLDEVIDNIVASLRMEGLELDPQDISDLYKVGRGEMTIDEAVQKIIHSATVEKVQ